mmetsp:Transcript_15222/g.17555  ORF Transcript_15222/g.17555 Transcript_15222/m.17555 type:complete len:218 (+) Transcript_15222:479-1132(+)
MDVRPDRLANHNARPWTEAPFCNNFSTTWYRPFSHATNRESFIFSARRSNNMSTISTCPQQLANHNAVTLSLLLILTSAPYFNRALTTSTSPRSQAIISTVVPPQPTKLTSAPFSNNRETNLELALAFHSGNLPTSFAKFILAPLRRILFILFSTKEEDPRQLHSSSNCKSNLLLLCMNFYTFRCRTILLLLLRTSTGHCYYYSTMITRLDRYWPYW